MEKSIHSARYAIFLKKLKKARQDAGLLLVAGDWHPGAHAVAPRALRLVHRLVRLHDEVAGGCSHPPDGSGDQVDVSASRHALAEEDHLPRSANLYPIAVAGGRELGDVGPCLALLQSSTRSE